MQGLEISKDFPRFKASVRVYVKISVEDLRELRQIQAILINFPSLFSLSTIQIEISFSEIVVLN